MASNLRSNLRFWAATQWWRLRMIATIGSHVLGNLARTVAWTTARRGREPVLALLEGDAVARIGFPNAYRTRVHNPTAEDRHATVHIRGWRDEDAEPAFELTWGVVLPPGASAERWLASAWRDDASVSESRPAGRAVSGIRPTGRWRVEARIDDRDPLRIAGMFVA